MDFRQTLDKHLRAIQTRDLPALIETLPAEALTVVMSDGRLVRNVEEFVALHRDWFASTTWSLGIEQVSMVESDRVGMALLRLDYRDRPAGGEPVHETSYLVLVFKRQGDRWVMVHDQNTPVRRPG